MSQIPRKTGLVFDSGQRVLDIAGGRASSGDWKEYEAELEAAATQDEFVREALQAFREAEALQRDDALNVDTPPGLEKREGAKRRRHR